MRVNDEDYVTESFPNQLRHKINLDGDLIVGANRLKEDGESVTGGFNVFVLLTLQWNCLF